MKQYFYFLIISLVMVSCTSKTATINSDSLSRDEINTQNIIGYWTEGDSPYAVAAFLKDGVYKGWLYENPKKERLLINMKGKWWIKNNQLFNKLTEINPAIPGFEPGKIVIDQIIEISKNEMTLIDEKGKKYKNIREQ